MSREQAEAERKRMAEENPEATWIIAEGDDGWRVIRVGIASATGALGTATEAKPRPPTPGDTSWQTRNNPYSF